MGQKNNPNEKLVHKICETYNIKPRHDIKDKDFSKYEISELFYVDWFSLIAERLRDYSEGDVWSTGDEILCQTESAADAIADIIDMLYKSDDRDVTVCVGCYDFDADLRNNDLDRYTGWWYVNLREPNCTLDNHFEPKKTIFDIRNHCFR